MPEMLQVVCRRRHRRDLRHLLRCAPRQDRRRGSRRRMTATIWPTPRGATGSRIRASAPVPRRPTAERRLRPGKAETVSWKIELAGDVQKRRQQRTLDLSRVHELRDCQDLDRASSPVRSAHAIAELVGSRSIPTLQRASPPYVLYVSSISAGATMARPVVPRGGR